ncbi:MAG TPA: nodulation protein NfeD, partial [bacterium]|nr:nodulation protein NfeD [bacterium]
MRKPRLLPFLSLLLAGLLLLAASSAASADGSVHVITLDDDIINPVSAEYISGAIDRAEGDGATALVIELDTPGGLLTSTRTIVRRIMNAKVPVVVYVAPKGARAGSAGVFITLAGHVAAMAPSTNIGAAHPVEMQDKRSSQDAFEELAKRLLTR